MSRAAATEQLSDGDLLRLSRKNDETAFLILYRRHQGPVFRFALHMSGSREVAEEVTQEVFLAMLSGAGQYAPAQGSIQGYLIGIARNHVRRQLRQIRTMVPDDADAGMVSHAASGEHMLDQLSRQQELGALRIAILKLPPNYREAVVLCDLEGMDYAQAAQQLGCALGTVRSRLHRARAILQTKLQRHDALRRRERCPA